MADGTEISWADETWSPWYGCTQVSMGEKGACVGCYARHLSETRMKRVVFGGPGRGIGTRDARADDAWKLPLKWDKRAARHIEVFRCNGGVRGAPTFVFPSMCDPFDNHPDLVGLRRRFFDLIHATPHLTWLLLTKRPQNIVKLFRDVTDLDQEHDAISDYWPKNAALGCTVVTQEEADRDLPALLLAKAALKPAFAFLSMEPLLGPVDLTKISTLRWPGVEVLDALRGELQGIMGEHVADLAAVDWVITGGETDQGKHKARPSAIGWFRDLRDQCAAAGVPFHFKQWGEWGPARMVPSETPGQYAFGDYNHDRSAMHQTDHYPRQFTMFGARAVMERIGKKSTGCKLDGVIHDARPTLAA